MNCVICFQFTYFLLDLLDEIYLITPVLLENSELSPNFDNKVIYCFLIYI
jgi:hypothetical protein